MKGQELKILFKDDLAFLTEEIALDFTQVQISYSPVKFRALAFWAVKVINYIESEKWLFVEVISYHVGETSFSANQIALADILVTIEKVTFKSIDTTGLLRTLNSKEPVKILQPKPEIIFNRVAYASTQTTTQKESIKYTYNEPFAIPIKDVMFISGKVVFEKKIQHFKKVIKFEIPNENIIEEYDAIKNYFANVLKTKKIMVIPTIITIDGKITSITATSTEIERIDETLIEEVKFQFINAASRKDISDNRQLFTIEEFLESFQTENFRAQQIFKNENDLFENLLEKSETKHYKHLRFLSSKHKQDLVKLRIIHKPLSFVFLLSGVDNLYIVWETIDTQEATYIWAYPHDVNRLNEFLTQTEKKIDLILKEKRIEYINRKEKNFNRVIHDYKDIQNGFKNWKNLIEKVIT